MNKATVIKNLDRCINWKDKNDCDGCLYSRQGEKCNIRLMADALSVIDEQQAHNENLKKENKYLRERLTEEAEIKEDMKGE